MTNTIVQKARPKKKRMSATKRFFNGKLPRKTHINYLVNFGLAAAFVSMGVTGLMISQSILPVLGLGSGCGENSQQSTGNGQRATSER